MSLTSKRVRRLEKEAILRSKDYEYTRERSEQLLSSIRSTSDDEETDRHRRQVTTRQIRQIQRDADYQIDMMDKLSERTQQELKKKKIPASSTTTQSNLTTSSSLATDRANRSSGTTEKYTSSKHTSGGKFH